MSRLIPRFFLFKNEQFPAEQKKTDAHDAASALPLNGSRALLSYYMIHKHVLYLSPRNDLRTAAAKPLSVIAAEHAERIDQHLPYPDLDMNMRLVLTFTRDLSDCSDGVARADLVAL